MSQIDQFLEALKKALKSKGIIYKDLSQRLKISESSVKRILSSKSLTLERLEEICRVTDINFSEVCRIADFNQEDQAGFFTDDQERALAENPRFCHYFILLDEGYTPAKILKDFDITAEEAQKYLFRLDKLNLIELHPKDRVKVPYRGVKRFRKEGPLGKILLEQTRTSYMQSQFKEPNELVRFQMGSMSSGTLAKLKTKIDKFVADLRDDMSFEDAEAPGVETYGVLMAVRPWKYAWMDSLKKRHSQQKK